MQNCAAWSWDEEKRLICDLDEVGKRFAEVHEAVVSADGERIAVPVLREPDNLTVCVNGEPWEGEYENVA